jgi:ribosomal protein S18 acetylase RimI-like enzyme
VRRPALKPAAAKPRARRAAVRIRSVETFDEAELKALTEPIFGNAARQRYLDGLVGADVAAREAALQASLPKPERIRLGAFDGKRLVGCSIGWFETLGRFYIGMSAVHADYRRRGIYTRLLHEMERLVRARGALQISSQHVATNNAVLIAKLRLGYVVAGTEYVDPMGLLVRLVLHLSPQRRALFESRTGTLQPPAA